MQNMHLLHALILIIINVLQMTLILSGQMFKVLRSHEFNMASNMATKNKKYILIH